MDKLDNLGDKEFLILTILIIIGISPFLILPLIMFTFMEVLYFMGYDNTLVPGGHVEPLRPWPRE